jgi:S-sulfosulfanyl-L-cysteine sulfohydrolase
VDKTMPPHFSTGLRFDVGNEVLPGLVESLRGSERVDVVVVLSHLGFPQDMQLAGEVAGIDVILSAHTHNRLSQPAIVNDTLVIQSGAHGSFAGWLDLDLGGSGVADYRHALIPIDAGIDPDPEVERMVDEIMSPHREMLSDVVGRTRSGLDRATSVESTMDTVMLDAMLDATGAQVAFANGWRYGAPIPPGDITMNDLFNMVPMDPPVSTVDLRGEEIVEMLEENMERTYARDAYEQMGGYLKRMGGAKAYIRVENPRGQRIQRIFIGDEELRPDATYQAVFVTAQGVAPEYGTNRSDIGSSAIEVLRSYLAKHDPLDSGVHGSYVLV